jgi:PI-3-kinase-related kinase SMG-1
MPTVAWKRLIPQLFSRLNHPDSFVRDYVTNLLIRIAKDYPQLILYSVIVGITDDSKMRRMKSRDENIYTRKSLSIHSSDDDRSQDEIEDDDDNEEEEESEDIEEEDDDIEKQENALAMQNSFRLIYNVLSETNANVVGQVKLFVHELRRVTVLWDELWLGTMAQLQEEISRLVSFFCLIMKLIIIEFLLRRVDALKDELHRLESMTHLTKEEKEFIIKEKQDILFKSVNNFNINLK